MAFVAYYFHWSSRDVMELDHASRRRWCREISEINEKISPGKKEKSILDM